MIQLDEEALICDLAETYQIFNYKQLPLTMVAVFSCGLKEDSRIKRKLSDRLVSLDTLLLGGVNDKLDLLIWFKTKDGQKGINRPSSIVESFSSKPPKAKESITFNSSEDFEKARQELIGGD